MSKSFNTYFYSLFKIFRQFSKNIKEIENLNRNIKDDKNRTIHYKVFSETNEYDESYLNIVLSRDANIEATCSYIKNNERELLKIKNLIIFYFRGKRKTNRDEKTINSLLNPKKSYSIEDVIKTVTSKGDDDVYDRTKFITPVAFTFPNIKYVKNEEKICFNTFEIFKNEFLDNWYENNSSSIMVIKGQGGIGKTTIAKYLSNYLLDYNPLTSKIFIDSFDAKSILLDEYHKNKNKVIDIYELYKAIEKNENKIDSLLFKNNLDAGNFFIIIDGIDELISKVKNFDILIFLKSLKDYFSIINNAKIIITCRTYFWSLEDTLDLNLEYIEINPFNREQTESFFNKVFFGNKLKMDKAMGLAIDFHKKNERHDDFHPYALDIISKIIKSNKYKLENKSTQVSKYLNQTETLDYIIDRICFRENNLLGKVRVLDLTVDQQIKVFKSLAINYNGNLSVDLIKKCISEAISDKNIPGNLVEAFKTHVLIELDEQKKIISFKYDFLNDFFKSIYIANYLNLELEEETISDELIELLKLAKFGSSLTRDVANRINKWTDDELLKISDLAQQIIEKELVESEEILSGLFNISYQVNSKHKNNTTIENTRLIENIFGNAGKIENLCLLDIYDNNAKIKFDFSNKQLQNCTFINYFDFWHCTFNNAVYFSNCKFYKLGEQLSKTEIPFTIENVAKDCKFDETFIGNFERNDLIKEEYYQRIKNFTQNFFRFFYTRGTLWAENYNDRQGFRKAFLFDFASFGDINKDVAEFLDIIHPYNMVEVVADKKHNVDKIRITKEYENDVIQFLEEGLSSEKIDEFFDKIYENIR